MKSAYAAFPASSEHAGGTHAPWNHVRHAQVVDDRFRQAFAKAAVGFAITTMDGVILHVNERFSHITGRSEAELVGSTFAAITHPDDLARKLELNHQLLAGEIEDYIVEKRYVRKDGGVTWAENSVSVLRDDLGRPVNMLILSKDITPEMQAQAQLRLLEAGVEHLNDVVFITEAQPLDEPGPRIEFVNDAFVRTTGYSREEALGRSPRFLQGPLTDRAALDRIRAALEDARPVVEEIVNYRKDGSAFHLEINITPVVDDGGRPSHFIAIQRDITERREAEATLRGAHKRLEEQREALSALMRGGVLQADDLTAALSTVTRATAGVLAVERVSIWRLNPRHDSLLCLQLHELTPGADSAGRELDARDCPAYFGALTKHQEIIANDARGDPRTRELLASYLDPLGITSLLDAPIHLNGGLEGVLCLEHVGAPRQWTADEQSFAVSTANLISLVLAQWERRRIEETLRQHASLLNKAQDAILVRDLNHTITYWNKGAERLYGWTSEEAVGRNVVSLLYQDDTHFMQAFDSVMRCDEWTGEIKQHNKARVEVIAEGRWTLVRDAAGIPTSILSINTDITEKKQLQEQFLRAQRMESIGTLAGGIAHDLNNVLTPILMSIDLLRLRIHDSASQGTLATIAASARRGASMIQQVLSFSKGMDGSRLPVSLQGILRDIAAIIRETFPKNIQLSLREAPGLWNVIGDATQIHQVLLNLCVNARDAMPAGGSLSISTQNLMIDAQFAAAHTDMREGPYVVLAVEDSGTGIGREIIDKIFDPFFTTKKSATGTGTGLGLSSSLAIIKGHGGFIRVTSEPGAGSRFSVHLPAEAIHEKAASITSMSAPTPRGNNELVLVVDDEATVRDITRQTLEAFGYRVLLAADGAEAVVLYAMQHDKIHAVLTDMMMPVMDGVATIQVLKKINPAARIIAASGVTTNGGPARAAEAGVSHFVAKPYTAETILQALHEALK